MKNVLHNVKWILFYVCVIGIILLLLIPKRPAEVIQGETIIDSIHHYDSIPTPYDSIVYYNDTIHADIDTLAVLSAYFTEFTYKDTIWTVDSLARVFIEEKTFMNKLIDRNVIISVKNTPIPLQRRNQMSLMLISGGALAKYEKSYGRFSLGVVGGVHKKTAVVGFSVSYRW